MKISKNILSEPNQPSIVSICQHIIITIFDKRILQNESDYFLYIKKKGSPFVSKERIEEKNINKFPEKRDQVEREHQEG